MFENPSNEKVIRIAEYKSMVLLKIKILESVKRIKNKKMKKRWEKTGLFFPL